MTVKKVRKMFSQEAKRIKKLIILSRIRWIFLILMGIGSAIIGLKWFLLPNGFLDGGVTGVSLLLNFVTWVDISLLIFCINIPFFILGYYQISPRFAIKTFMAVTLLVVALKFIDVPMLTSDKLLVSVFWGFFLWAGIGLAVRGGSVIDGTEVLAVFVSRNSILTVWDFIGLFNICLFLVATLLISVEVALYSMLTYIAASKTVDFVIQGIEEYTWVIIVSRKATEIENAIIENLERGVTVYKWAGWYGSHGEDDHKWKILFSIVTRLEVQKMVVEIQKIDENAFIAFHPITDVRGGIIKKRPLH